MPLHKNRFGPVDARMYHSVMSSLRTLGIMDCPLTNFVETRVELYERLQKFARDCGSYPLDIIEQVENSLVSLLNISHLVRDSQHHAFEALFTEQSQQKLLKTLQIIQASRKQISINTEMPIASSR